MECRGFIVHAYARTRKNRTRLYFLGRLEEGGTFAVVEDRFRCNFFIRESEQRWARSVPELETTHWVPVDMRTMDGERCVRVEFGSSEQRDQARNALAREGIRSYEADLRPTDQFRLEREIHGPVRIVGESSEGRRVDRVFKNPELSPADWQPRLSLLSLDIETNAATSEVLAIGLSLSNPYGQNENLLLFNGSELETSGILCFGDERSLLSAFRDQLERMDPDILTGWNVIDFDFRVLTERFQVHRLPLLLGRSDDKAAYLTQNQGRNSRMIIPGRQIWDGVRLVRASPDRYDDYSLDTVAGAVLGEGKDLEIREGEKKVQTIQRLYREDPLTLCRYCLRDAQLVHEIFARTGLYELTLNRCLLIGVAPDRAWTSIPAFEHLYMESMHGRAVVAPSAGVDVLPMEGAPGGIILPSRPGLYDQVQVFDFQSLYPSIIRTFNIDPLSRVETGRDTLAEDEDLIQAPNGACFRREPAILPALLDRFFENREQAKKRGDKIASFVYKIIMNSFYGVLGAQGCRFAGSDLAGAITSFGQHLMGWCKSFLEDRGYRVLYGDTDSLFVIAENTVPDPPETIVSQVNDALGDYLRQNYGVESRLLLEFEKSYTRFFLPPLRTTGEQTTRGRAKGYAGLLSDQGADRSSAEGVEEDAGSVRSRIEIKGMEAIRRDWTDLAHDFQFGFLQLIFEDRRQDVGSFVKETIKALSAGTLDHKLVYRKALRKSIAEYTRNTPPHVKAAALLDPEDQRGLIRYLMTREGPQPESRVSAPLDYPHYVDKQLKPIAGVFCDVLGLTVEQLLGQDNQLSLF